MSVKVTSTDGELATFAEADSVDVINGFLHVEKGQEIVALYAAGQWIHADIIKDDA